MRDAEMFAAMTGDRKPIRHDASLTVGKPFGGLIMQGGVTSGLLNAIVAEELCQVLAPSFSVWSGGS